MPEGDTIFRTAAQLRPRLAGQRIVAARAPRPGPAIEHVVGSTVMEVEARGKHLSIRFDNGLMLHTHMRMNGVWHTYSQGERWRRPAWQARVVLETAEAVAVCFNAPVVELIRQSVALLHRPLAGLGPDLMAVEFDLDEAMRRLRDPQRTGMTIGEALLDQRAVAGAGNVYKSEVLFVERLDPFTPLPALGDERLAGVIARVRGMLQANRDTWARTTTTGAVRASGVRMWVYGRTRRPCLRCGTAIRSGWQGKELPRRTYWCPRCQPGGEEPSG